MALIGQHRYKSNRSLGLVVDFNGEETVDGSPFGTVIESSYDGYKIGTYQSWNPNPSLWEPLEVIIKYVPTQEGDKEDDI